MGFYFWLIPGADTGNQEGISPSADGDQPARLDRAGSQTRTRLSPAGESGTQSKTHSAANTATQATLATVNREHPRHAIAAATIKPTRADHGVPVALRMAGKVMTAKVA